MYQRIVALISGPSDPGYDPLYANDLWTQLGSRIDVNMARARRRAYLDAAPIAGAE